MTSKTVTIQEANVGDSLEDGSVVLSKENGLALLVAPKSTEVVCSWSQDFPEVYTKLQEEGFNPSQWFVPTVEQLQLAYEHLKNEFDDSAVYWSSTECNGANACWQSFFNGNFFADSKTDSNCVRAFRCVTY